VLVAREVALYNRDFVSLRSKYPGVFCFCLAKQKNFADYQVKICVGYSSHWCSFPF